MPCPPDLEIYEGGSLGAGFVSYDDEGNIKPIGRRVSRTKVVFTYRKVAEMLCRQGLRARC